MPEIMLETRDGQRISAVHYDHGHKKVVVLAHGFFNNKDVHLFKELARKIGESYDVIAFDFRGHGKSSGLFSWTSRESADIRAVIEYAQGFRYEAVGLIGFSLGAAISLIEASRNPAVKTVISVAGPYSFWQINFHFWEPGMLDDLRLNLGYKGRGKCIRPGNIFERKTIPLSIVDKISPRPVLFVHGADDWLIKPSHSQKLYERAGAPKAIKIIPHGGHAELLFDEFPDLFMATCLDWFNEHL